MVVDTSAIIAILRKEPEGRAFIDLIERSDVCYMSAMSMLEAGILAHNARGANGPRDLDDFIKDAAITIEPFTEEQAGLAREAFATYGKGRHPARLNFGDCAAYALAKLYGEPLLFKGADFAQTDITPAYPPQYPAG